MNSSYPIKCLQTFFHIPVNRGSKMYGDTEEKKVVEISLANLGHEMKNGNYGGVKEALPFLALLITTTCPDQHLS